MTVKQDGTLYAKDLKARQVPDAARVEAPFAPVARFIGTGDLVGYDTPCRVLEVIDARGRGVNDAVDAGEVHVIIEVNDAEGGSVQLKVARDEGYFIDVVGPAPAGLPTGEHTPGASFDTQKAEDPQSHLRDLPAQDQTGPRPGEPALAAIAGAGQHGDPVSDAEKQRRAEQAQASRDHAAELSERGAGGAVAPTEEELAAESELSEEERRELEDAHARIYGEELRKTPDDPARALQVANEATGLNVTLQPEGQREDV